MSYFIVKAEKLVTVSEKGTIIDGAMLIQDGKIVDIGTWQEISQNYDPSITVVDYQNYVITPSLVDCHTHLLEFAPSSIYPITNETHILAGKSILLNALSSGITALGEQVCGNPMMDVNLTKLKQVTKDIPIDISFATTSISIGFQPLVHFTAITGSNSVNRDLLIKPKIIYGLAEQSEFAGENIFINATPANFTKDLVPLAGEIIYSQVELDNIVQIFHSKNKKIGTHVAGEVGIEMALQAKFDVLHHAHGITNEQIKRAAAQHVQIVATPLGGTHLPPNTTKEVIKMIKSNIPVSISTDAYLPPHEQTIDFPLKLKGLVGPDALMAIAHPYMTKMIELDYDENDALALITRNPAKILEKDCSFGSLAIGRDANFIVAEGIPGLEIVDKEKIKVVYICGKKVIQRTLNEL